MGGSTVPEKVGLEVVEAVGVGDVPVTMQFKVSDNKKAVLYDVLLVPKLVCNLFSVRAATRKVILSDLVGPSAGFETTRENFMVWARLEENCTT